MRHIRILISILSILCFSTTIFSQTTINLTNQCNCEVITAAGIPMPGSPPAYTGNLYVDSNTGAIYSFDGTNWTAAQVPVVLTGSGATTVSGSFPNFTVSSTDNVNDADFVIGNEYNTNATLTGTTLNIIDGGGSKSVDLSPLQDGVNDADFVIGNEYNTNATLSGTTLNIIDGGGTRSVNLSSLRGTTGVTAGSGLTGGGTGTTPTINAAANNGINVDASSDRIQLGGALTETTTITHGANTMVHNLNSSGNFLIRDNNTAFFAAINNGRIGIGTESPSYKLHVVGRVKSNGINETSDVRFKENITALENSLDKILLLRGVNYKWKTDDYPEMGFEDGKQLGVIAQEIESVFPEVVHTDSEGYKSVEYSHLVPVLIEGIKELNTEVQQLNDQYSSEINQLQEKNHQLEAKVNSILELLSVQK